MPAQMIATMTGVETDCDWREAERRMRAKLPRGCLVMSAQFNQDSRGRIHEWRATFYEDANAAPPKPAPAAGPSRTCEFTRFTVSGTTECGEPARYKILGPKAGGKYWFCCADCKDIPALLRDGLAVPLDGTPAPESMPATRPTRVDPIAAKRARLQALVTVSIAAVQARYGMSVEHRANGEIESSHAEKLEEIARPWTARLYAMVSPTGLPAGVPTLVWARADGATMVPRWEVDGREFTFVEHVAARDLDRLIARLTADPLCGEGR